MNKKISLLIMVTIACANLHTLAHAQSEPEWTPPLKLSESVLNDVGEPAPTMSPIFAADIWGTVHAIFPVMTERGEDANYDTLFYASFNGEQWTLPNDILHLGNGEFWLPQLIVDNEGWLHLLWKDGPKARYSRSSVESASSAISWSEPIEIGNDSIGDSSILVGSDSYIHMAYCSRNEPNIIAYVKSIDGVNWSQPVGIAESGGCRVRVAEDDRGRLHVVFSEQPGAGAGTAVYYARSVDDGANWSSPLEIDVKDAGYLENYGPSWINIAAIGADEIHVVWDGSPAGQRWHQFSIDGGESWSEPKQISSLHRGLTEPNALSVDSAGNLHMLSLGWLDTPDRPKAPFYASWNGESWSNLELIGQRGDWDPEGGSAVILGGNLLVAGWRHQTGEGNEVWVSTLYVNAPEILPSERALSSATVSSQSEPVSNNTIAESLSSNPTRISFVENPLPSSVRSINPVFLASLLVILIVSVILFIQLKRRK